MHRNILATPTTPSQLCPWIASTFFTQTIVVPFYFGLVAALFSSFPHHLCDPYAVSFPYYHLSFYLIFPFGWQTLIITWVFGTEITHASPAMIPCRYILRFGGLAFMGSKGVGIPYDDKWVYGDTVHIVDIRIGFSFGLLLWYSRVGPGTKHTTLIPRSICRSPLLFFCCVFHLVGVSASMACFCCLYGCGF